MYTSKKERDKSRIENVAFSNCWTCTDLWDSRGRLRGRRRYGEALKDVVWRRHGQHNR